LGQLSGVRQVETIIGGGVCEKLHNQVGGLAKSHKLVGDTSMRRLRQSEDVFNENIAREESRQILMKETT
jgi:alanine dehydrogenase